MAGGAVSGSPLEMFLVLPELLVLWMGEGVALDVRLGANLV
jgi:hypothetical protein